MTVSLAMYEYILLFPPCALSKSSFADFDLALMSVFLASKPCEYFKYLIKSSLLKDNIGVKVTVS